MFVYGNWSIGKTELLCVDHSSYTTSTFCSKEKGHVPPTLLHGKKFSVFRTGRTAALISHHSSCSTLLGVTKHSGIERYAVLQALWGADVDFQTMFDAPAHLFCRYKLDSSRDLSNFVLKLAFNTLQYTIGLPSWNKTKQSVLWMSVVFRCFRYGYPFLLKLFRNWRPLI